MKRNISTHVFTLSTLLLLLTSCGEFVFGRIEVAPEDDPRIQHKIPRTKMDLYQGKKNETPNLSNPDPNGAFANWGSCYLMFKEGHDHGDGMMHGNYVYEKGPWPQEEFLEVFNRPSGQHPEIVLDSKSINTYLENERKLEAPKHIRLIGGAKRRWALLLNFFDKEGNLMNDSILKHSNEYQIFYCISDLDSEGEPYDVMDVRWQGKGQLTPTEEPKHPRGEEPIPSPYFKDKKSLEERQKHTPEVFQYTYRDTWRKDDMANGVNAFYNIKLLPPLTKKEAENVDQCDIDCVGLKGHFSFDWGWDNGIDAKPWVEKDRIKKSDDSFFRPYTRDTHLLPKFYLAVRVMKRKDGNKLLVKAPENRNYYKARGAEAMECSPHTGPIDPSGWEEIIRFNIPVCLIADAFDSDPTSPNAYEPFYVSIAKEIRVTPEEAYELSRNRVVVGNDGSGGQGYGSFFL
ncbi:hypothetical protein [Porphyromonas levii]|uniref:hypothetical protein n=1 Tax=Porphyromonas levii TaxID=28114 RepID=UPI00036A925A|nr:hypothetical protein [Porphyromonas levii]